MSFAARRATIAAPGSRSNHAEARTRRGGVSVSISNAVSRGSSGTAQPPSSHTARCRRRTRRSCRSAGTGGRETEAFALQEARSRQTCAPAGDRIESRPERGSRNVPTRRSIGIGAPQARELPGIRADSARRARDLEEIAEALHARDAAADAHREHGTIQDRVRESQPARNNVRPVSHASATAAFCSLANTSRPTEAGRPAATAADTAVRSDTAARGRQ